MQDNNSDALPLASTTNNKFKTDFHKLAKSSQLNKNNFITAIITSSTNKKLITLDKILLICTYSTGKKFGHITVFNVFE